MHQNYPAKRLFYDENKNDDDFILAIKKLSMIFSQVIIFSKEVRQI